MRNERYEVYDETVHGPNQRRGIEAGDWRDPDNVLDLRDNRVVEANGKVVVQNDRGEHIDIQRWLKDQVGRVLVLPIIARDQQQHN